MRRRFLLHYHVRSGGDGSARPVFHSSEEKAREAEELEYEPLCESTGDLDLRINGDVIERLEREWVWTPDPEDKINGGSGKLVWKWIPLPTTDRQ